MKRLAGMGLALALSVSTAHAEAPRVVTDIAPVKALVARVMTGVGDPTLVVPTGASPHGYSLRPSEARALSRAELVIWVGPSLTPWLEAPIATLADAAPRLELMAVAGTVHLNLRDGDGFAAHDHAEGHTDGHDHADEHDHSKKAEAGAVDPHGWLDPHNGAIWLAAIADRLSDLDPEHASVYQANARAGQAEIAAAETAIADMLAPTKGVPFVVFHDAFHYFETRFGVEAVAAISLGDATTPGPAHLDAVQEVVMRTGATCAFVEPQVNTSLLTAISEGTALRPVIVDPLIPKNQGTSNDYVEILMHIAEEFSTCLRG